MHTLHTTILGKGRPLLILHGYFGMSDNWRTLGKQFAESNEVHLIDHRNHGRSFHSDDFDYELMVEDLFYYIGQNELDKVNLLGHSMGGKVAMLFAVTYPDFVDKLLVADISPRFYTPHHQHILAALNAVNFSIYDSRQKVQELLKMYLKDESLVQFLLKNVYWKEKGKLGFRFNLQALTENNSEVGEALPNFTNFDGPTLFLRGDRSDYITESDEAQIKTHFENAIIRTVKNAGHWLHADNPVQFAAEVVSFLHND